MPPGRPAVPIKNDNSASTPGNDREHQVIGRQNRRNTRNTACSEMTRKLDETMDRATVSRITVGIGLGTSAELLLLPAGTAPRQRFSLMISGSVSVSQPFNDRALFIRPRPTDGG